MTVESIKSILISNGFKIKSEERTGNNAGVKITLDNGAIINCFDTGKLSYQGKNTDRIRELLNGTAQLTIVQNKKVFVVYGHDSNARTQLEAMLRRWDLEPLILDQLASSGQTIIEKLEACSNVGFGIVLYTPCDIGAKKGNEETLLPRARQNVVFEHGYLIAKLGRNNVVTLMKNTIKDKIEIPSDILGIAHIFYQTGSDWRKQLAIEMEKAGYAIDWNKVNKTKE